MSGEMVVGHVIGAACSFAPDLFVAASPVDFRIVVGVRQGCTTSHDVIGLSGDHAQWSADGVVTPWTISAWRCPGLGCVGSLSLPHRSAFPPS